MSGSFTSKYSDRQKQAIIEAVLHRDLKVTHAVRLAGEGQLENGLGPFTVLPDTARKWVDRAKTTLAAKAPGVMTGLESLEEAWNRECQRSLGRAKRPKGGGEPNDFEEMLKLAKVGVELQRMRKVQPSKSGVPEQQGKSWIEALSDA
jgi:hypothetical protein